LHLSLAWIFEEEALAHWLTLHDMVGAAVVTTPVVDAHVMVVACQLLDVEVMVGGTTTSITPIDHNVRSASSTVILLTNASIGTMKTMCLSRGTPLLLQQPTTRRTRAGMWTLAKTDHITSEPDKLAI
jgi:hypothetical protein